MHLDGVSPGFSGALPGRRAQHTIGSFRNPVNVTGGVRDDGPVDYMEQEIPAAQGIVARGMTS